MQDCPVCRRRFDPLSFQVVVPELGRGFDRIECAQSARVLAALGSRIAAAPLVAVVEPIAAPASALGRVAALRPIAAPAATVGLLAAGTAAAAALWVPVLGTDTARFPLDRGAAPPAVAQETVHADVFHTPDESGRSVVGAHRARPVPDAARPVVTASREHPRRSTHPEASRPARSTGRSVVTRATVGTAARPTAPETGKGHIKRGKGHYKHGETDGIHEPGHGRHGPHGHRGHGHRGHGKAH